MVNSQLYVSSGSLQQELDEKNALIWQLQEECNKLQEELDKIKRTVIQPTFGNVLEDLKGAKLLNSHLQAFGERLKVELANANLTIAEIKTSRDTLQLDLDNKNFAIRQLKADRDTTHTGLEKKEIGRQSISRKL